MSRYRGPHFKKIHCLGALAGLTSKRPRSGSDLRNQSRFGKSSQYHIRLEEKQKLRFHYGLTERQLLIYVRIAGKALTYYMRTFLRAQLATHPNLATNREPPDSH